MLKIINLVKCYNKIKIISAKITIDNNDNIY